MQDWVSASLGHRAVGSLETAWYRALPLEVSLSCACPLCPLPLGVCIVQMAVSVQKEYQLLYRFWEPQKSTLRVSQRFCEFSVLCSGTVLLIKHYSQRL